MSPLEVLQLVGYSIGAVLPVWLGVQLITRRGKLTKVERLLFLLALTMGGWHGSNLVITLHSLFGFGYERWTTVLRLADSVSVISITFAYSLLLHVHLYFWAAASNRPLKWSEKARVYLSYLPNLFLAVALYKIWFRPYAPMLSRLHFLVFPMAVWITYVLGVIAITELLIARKTRIASEQRIMRTLAASFIVIGIVILAALAFGLGEGSAVGLYLKTVANLGSLLPSLLLAYYIYRYRYLELIIEESLIVASFAAVVLIIYVYGIKTIGDWTTARYGIRSGVVEALLILGLVLAAAPLRGWLEKRFRKLFEREAALYRQIVSRISAHAGKYRELPALLEFVEKETTTALGFRRVKIALREVMLSDNVATRLDQPDEVLSGAQLEGLIDQSRQNNWNPIVDNPELSRHGFTWAYPVRRDERVSGLLLVEANNASLTSDSAAVLTVLAGQIAIAVEDCRLVEENVKLERKLADGERLAALGQMAATVAHEIKNPLSAIKSIAQVMGEDDRMKEEYARDLSLIVGETDRLGQSVTQLLSFARTEPPAELSQSSSQLIASVVRLFQIDSDNRGVKLQVQPSAESQLSGQAVAAVRVALSNLILNALQATQTGDEIIITETLDKGDLIIGVADTGPGIPAELEGRIWEPFFTTRQRGTGLGLAIVRKRMEEVGGTARFIAGHNGQRSRFELVVPLGKVIDRRS
ncbi:MAG TPA: ATP-binding protein [Pyrinomonadaceae bacterium]|nr:ATP-binding protein [Pyrinomonadaceae bacterium]